jgi:tryptophan halogenase
VRWLESTCRALGVEITEGTMSEAERAADGIAALRLEMANEFAADFFVDASGFARNCRSVSSRAAISLYKKRSFATAPSSAAWPRTDEPIHPYTSAKHGRGLVLAD